MESRVNDEKKILSDFEDGKREMWNQQVLDIRKGDKYSDRF